MHPDDGTEIQQLAVKYFVEELGLALEDIPEASRNLLGAFDVLMRIDERLKKQNL